MQFFFGSRQRLNEFPYSGCVKCRTSSNRAGANTTDSSVAPQYRNLQRNLAEKLTEYFLSGAGNFRAARCSLENSHSPHIVPSSTLQHQPSSGHTHTLTRIPKIPCLQAFYTHDRCNHLF